MFPQGRNSFLRERCQGIQHSRACRKELPIALFGSEIIDMRPEIVKDLQLGSIQLAYGGEGIDWVMYQLVAITEKSKLNLTWKCFVVQIITEEPNL